MISIKVGILVIMNIFLNDRYYGDNTKKKEVCFLVGYPKIPLRSFCKIFNAICVDVDMGSS